MEYGSCEGAIDVGVAEGLKEVLHGSGAAGGNQRNVTHFTDLSELIQIVTVAHAVLVHHVEDDFSCSALLYLLHPIQRLPLGDASPAFIAGVLINVIFTGLFIKPGIDTYHDALHAKAIGEAGN